MVGDFFCFHPTNLLVLNTKELNKKMEIIMLIANAWTALMLTLVVIIKIKNWMDGRKT